MHHTVPQQLSSTKVLKRVPRASRLPAATKLASILDGIVKENDDWSWDRHFRFCSRCLRVPKRGGHRRSLAGEDTQLISEEADPPPLTRPGEQGSRPAHYPLNSLAALVSCKLEEGTSEESFASFVLRIPLQNGTKLHLQLSGLSILHHSCIPPVPEHFAPAIQVSDEEIAHAISSFLNGSSGGPDGLRPQHLNDLISTSAERGDRELLRTLTSFVNLVLGGKTPPSARPFFFGATLTPLGKEGGGIRPIAVGHTLHRLVAKCAKNAFNCLRCDKMLMTVRESIPELF